MVVFVLTNFNLSLFWHPLLVIMILYKPQRFINNLWSQRYNTFMLPILQFLTNWKIHKYASQPCHSSLHLHNICVSIVLHLDNWFLLLSIILSHSNTTTTIIDYNWLYLLIITDICNCRVAFATDKGGGSYFFNHFNFLLLSEI